MKYKGMRGIIINKDVEEYEYDVWKGFSARQLVFGGAAVGAAASIILVAYLVCYVPIQGAVYLGIPVGVVIALLGFLKVDDMNLTDYAKEIWRLTFSEPLVYASEEFEADVLRNAKKAEELAAGMKEMDAAVRKEQKSQNENRGKKGKSYDRRRRKI